MDQGQDKTVPVTEQKHDLKSMTVWGLILILVGFLKQKFGWDIADAKVEQYLDVGLQVGGVAVAYFGRKRKGDLWTFAKEDVLPLFDKRNVTPLLLLALVPLLAACAGLGLGQSTPSRAEAPAIHIENITAYPGGAISVDQHGARVDQSGATGASSSAEQKGELTQTISVDPEAVARGIGEIAKTATNADAINLAGLAQDQLDAGNTSGAKMLLSKAKLTQASSDSLVRAEAAKKAALDVKAAADKAAADEKKAKDDASK